MMDETRVPGEKQHLTPVKFQDAFPFVSQEGTLMSGVL